PPAPPQPRRRDPGSPRVGERADLSPCSQPAPHTFPSPGTPGEGRVRVCRAICEFAIGSVGAIGAGAFRLGRTAGSRHFNERRAYTDERRPWTFGPARTDTVRLR